MLSSVTALVERLRADRDIVAVGMAAAGFIDLDRAIVRSAPNIAWHDEPLRDRVAERIALPVVLENDANAAGWAEHRFGAGRGVRHLTMLTIGTGVGGAVIIDGVLVHGASGLAGELGHIRLVPDGLPCGCGARGCLEQYASGSALLRIVDRMADADSASPFAAARSAGGASLDLLRALLAQRHPDALGALAELGAHLGEGCASIAAMLDPQRFVIGGGVAEAGEALLEPVRAAYRRSAFASGSRSEPEFRIAELGNLAGVIGAADLARTAASHE